MLEPDRYHPFPLFLIGLILISLGPILPVVGTIVPGDIVANATVGVYIGIGCVMAGFVVCGLAGVQTVRFLVVRLRRRVKPPVQNPDGPAESN